MVLVEGWMPPTRENYEKILFIWKLLYPAIGSAQFIIKWYGMGKTSKPSRFNLPGRLGWFLMEVPGFATLLYIMKTLPKMHGIDDLPWQNRVLAGLFVIHYSYRAVIFPFIQPSMAPIHILVSSMAIGFQLFNGTCIGSYLAAYGPVTEAAWAAQSPLPQFVGGIALFYVGLASNYFHDEELRDIRRRENHRQERLKAQSQNVNGSREVERHYQIPRAGLFKYMLFPHYFCEWVEWFGYWMAAGWVCVPARTFLVNEIFTMLPRAINGKRWYIEKFGEEKVGKKWAVIPGIW
ncbi:hypothetical protein NLU13_4395 [Sarocladium strictum]|uniref:3-oxo-5-alpha-steroid 4-dehydrogenase C-terminal domain-containing protein n=1 Tax=Sarocladium strictum TaxID=5046 RepID=A0AA39GIS8_SARSR|nr:hypothetical protein NLU13_4395 [Sarocladium strictum]